MNAIQFLLKEHNKVRDTLIDICDKSHREKTKKKMFDTLSHDLIRHELMEEELWYPHFKDNEKIDDTVRHLISQEHFAEIAIKKFKQIKTEEEWNKKFLKFKKNVMHHASEEEQKLFPIVEKILTEEELVKIGKEMQQFKKEYDA